LIIASLKHLEMKFEASSITESFLSASLGLFMIDNSVILQKKHVPNVPDVLTSIERYISAMRSMGDSWDSVC